MVRAHLWHTHTCGIHTAMTHGRLLHTHPYGTRIPIAEPHRGTLTPRPGTGQPAAAPAPQPARSRSRSYLRLPPLPRGRSGLRRRQQPQRQGGPQRHPGSAPRLAAPAGAAPARLNPARPRGRPRPGPAPAEGWAPPAAPGRRGLPRHPPRASTAPVPPSPSSAGGMIPCASSSPLSQQGDAPSPPHPSLAHTFVNEGNRAELRARGSCATGTNPLGIFRPPQPHLQPWGKAGRAAPQTHPAHSSLQRSSENGSLLFSQAC